MQKKKTPLFGFDENNARCWLAANTSKDSKQYRLYIVTILYTQLNPSQLIEQIIEDVKRDEIMEATKVKVRERDLAVRRHRT